jgi:hypothetical protein
MADFPGKIHASAHTICLAYFPETVMNCDDDYVNKPEKYKCLGNTIDGNLFNKHNDHFSRKWPILPGKYMQVLSISHKMADHFAFPLLL